MKVITFSDSKNIANTLLYTSCQQNGLELIVLGPDGSWKRNSFKLKYLREFLDTAAPNELYLVVDAFDVVINAQAEQISEQFLKLKSDIVFSAEANFYFREPDLRYYYWKFYPRSEGFYDYLNSGSFMGKGQHLFQMLSDIADLYQLDLQDEKALERIRSDQYLYSRFFVDTASQFFQAGYRIGLDYQQQLFGCTGGRMAVVKWPLASKIHSFLFFQYERKLLKTFRMASQQTAVRDLKFRDGAFRNLAINTAPSVIHLPAARKNFKRILSRLKGDISLQPADLWKPAAFLVSFTGYLQSLFSLGLIKYINKGITDQNQLFRYGRNLNPEYAESTEKLAQLLHKKVPFSFSHYNDGELTFIGKYQAGSHEQEWFGRKQNQYSTKLGQLLGEAFVKMKENYFIGIPCGTCHPEHRALAEQLREKDKNTVPAMTIHHNLSYLPAMLGSLRHRKVYYMVNEFQDLTVLEKLGLQVREEQVIRVPFKNSYELYDDLKERRFEKEAVVLMMCGMLAKILCPVWFDRNPGSTFLALGSALDDLIQKKSIKFRLFPAEFPFTRNIYAYRSFLFGYKKGCDECFRLG